MNSNEKGKRGEREWAEYLRSKGYEARRGQQYAGHADAPDVLCPDLPVYWEVKRVQALNAMKALAKAESEAHVAEFPIVVWRKNGTDWVAILKADDLMVMLDALLEIEGKGK